MTPAERIADDTWHKLKEARELTVRLGEETLTDLLILDMRRHMATHKIWVYQTTRPQEARSGTDLLMAVRDGKTADARLYAIQAKKLYPSRQYTALKKGNDAQLDTLETFARCNKALPYYLFYNFVTDPKFVSAPSDYWLCGKSYDEPQLGCTLVPSWIVRKALGAPRQCSPRSFPYMHEPRQALPWRCLFDCPHWEHGLSEAWPDGGGDDGISSKVSPYGSITIDPVPGGWPTELEGDGEVDLALIVRRYVDDRLVGFVPGSLPTDVYAPSLGTEDRGMTLARAFPPPEFRPRRFIFVDKTVQ